jgi:hypothetical protein
VEQAALTADAWLHGLLLIGTVVIVARQFGGFASALVGVALVLMYPLAGVFMPGRPGVTGLSLVMAMSSGLASMVGMAGRFGRRVPVRWFATAGACGAIGLWVDGPVHLPLLLGIALGGALAAGLSRASSASDSWLKWPWRAWGLAGAIGILVGYGLEYLPSGGNWELGAIHPLYGFAWLGLAELLARWSDPEQRTTRSCREHWAGLAAAIGAVAALPLVMMATDQAGFFSSPAGSDRLTELRGGVAAADLLDWLVRGQSVGALVATLLPLALVVVLVVRIVRAPEDAQVRPALVVILGPLTVALALAVLHLRWWAVADTLLLAALPVVLAGPMASTPGRRLTWVLAVLVVLAPGARLVWPERQPATAAMVSEPEIQALIERDLAQWLANRRGPAGAVVLAPPQLTASLIYYGGLRGLGTPYPENRDGFAAAVRLSSPASADEAQGLFEGRGVTHVVMPSWDDFLQRYAQLGSPQPEDSLMGLLQRWLPPRWLRPIPYQLPVVEGFEGRSVVVFEVVEVQEQVTALSRLAEYFVEMEQGEQAEAVAAALEYVYPEELESLVARAQVQVARSDAPAFAQLVRSLLPLLARGADQTLPVDQRASLAVVLAQGRQLNLARGQVERCLAEADEAALRAMTTTGLYRLQTLAQALGLRFADPARHELARQLLPPELREQLPRR